MTFLRRMAKQTAIFCYRCMNFLLPVRRRRIVFSSSLGKSYSGNPRHIYEHLVRAGYDRSWECIWFYEEKPFAIPGRVKQVRFRSFAYLRYMATARVWVFDSRQPAFIRKKGKARYLQTWHGTPLKKLGLDMDAVFMSDGIDLATYKKNFADNAHTWDYLISQNPFSTKTFRRCFDFRGKMLEYGYPRNDILIRHNDPDWIRKRKAKMGIPEDKKVLLYAPTWRDDEFTGNQQYSFRPAMDFDRMKERLGDRFVMIVKYHYLICDAIDWTPYEGFVVPVDQTQDISELYLVSDALITDYSSVMFDYSILGRPMFFFAYDLDKYKNTLRGFYFDYEEEMPGPIMRTTEELINEVLAWEEVLAKLPLSDASDTGTAYREKYQVFREKYNPFDDGRACAKVLSLLTKLLS